MIETVAIVAIVSMTALGVVAIAFGRNYAASLDGRGLGARVGGNK